MRARCRDVDNRELVDVMGFERCEKARLDGNLRRRQLDIVRL